MEQLTKMRAFLVFGFALAVVASPLQEANKSYHADIGIPLAAKIKEHEAALTTSQRIVGGILAPTNAHPYFAGLLIDIVGSSGQSVCGASLISSNRLVTAAHCWIEARFTAWRFTVILGTNFLFSGGTRVMTSDVVVHPQWDTDTLNNDIAIISLPNNVLFSEAINPIELPSSNEVWESFEDNWALAVGFGRTSDDQVGASTVVSQVNLRVITIPECAAVYGWRHVLASTLCTSGVGTVGICGGDSGGPLSLVHLGRRILVGVSSFVPNAGCTLGHPSAFARVTSFRDFILQNL